MPNRIRHWRDWPLFARLAVTMVLAAILPALVLTVIDTVSLRTSLLSGLEQRNLDRSSATTAEIRSYLQDKLGGVKTIAASPAVFTFFSGPAASRKDSSLPTELVTQAREGGYESLIVTDRSGSVVAASDNRLLGISFATNPAFVWALGGMSVIDDPLYDARDGQVFLHFSTPVNLPGATAAGTVIGRVTLASLDAAVSRDTNYGGNGEYGILWNEHGVRLSQPSQDSLRFRPLAPLTAAAAREMTSIQRYGPATSEKLKDDSRLQILLERSTAVLNNPATSSSVEIAGDNGQILISISQVQVKRWLYGIASPVSAVNAAVQAGITRSLIIVFAAAVLALVAAWALARGWVHIVPTVREIRQALSQEPAVKKPVGSISGTITAETGGSPAGSETAHSSKSDPTPPPQSAPEASAPSTETTPSPEQPTQPVETELSGPLPYLDTGASTLAAAPVRDVLPGPPPALQLNAPPTDVRNRETALEVPPPAAPIELPEKTPAPVPETAPVNHAEATATVSADAPGTPEAIPEPEPEDKPPEKPGRRSGWSGPMTLPPV